MSDMQQHQDAHTNACDRLEAELRREGGESTVLVVGARRCGKTTVCETVMRRMDRHIVRWTPYEEFLVGHVSSVYSGRDTIVFVDDADILVRLAKGSSVSLMEAMELSKHRPRLKIVMTALDIKGRVWRSVAGRVGVLQVLPSLLNEPPVSPSTRPRHGFRRDEHDAWVSALRNVEYAVAAKSMKNWCDARDADAMRECGETNISDDATDTDSDTDGCVVRKIAHILQAR